MKAVILTYILLMIGNFSYSQQTDYWTVFWDKKEENFGFKDQNGKVIIQPKFGFMSFVKRLDYVFIASEIRDEKVDLYYLTKSGKSFGRDSVYFWDNTPDCESEGFIRFRDRKTEKVGMFNRNGEVVIPAIYNELSQVKNGLIFALIDAKKKFWEEHDHSGCNHFSWTDGHEVLIDTINNILVENFKYDNSLNFFTLEKTKIPHSDTTRKSFLAIDGSYYSFIDFEKEFKQWITKELQNDLTIERLISISYDIITWETQNGWGKSSKERLIEDNFTILKNGLLQILEPNTDYFISSDGLNPFMFEGTEFEKYFNNCGESKNWIYPTMSIIISHGDKKNFTQNHYEFLRTDNGYKLIRLTIRNEKMK